MHHPRAEVVDESDLLCCLPIHSHIHFLLSAADFYLILHVSVIKFHLLSGHASLSAQPTSALHRSCRLPESLGLFQALPQALSRPQIHRQNDGPAPS